MRAFCALIICAVGALVLLVDARPAKQRLKFIGNGDAVSTGKMIKSKTNNLKLCQVKCSVKRMMDGEDWNGLVYIAGEAGDLSGVCWCYQNDKGHKDMWKINHYRWEK